MSNLTVTLLADFSHNEELEIGQVLYLHPDPNNEHDPHAIEVYADNDSAKWSEETRIGFLAKSSKMVLPGTVNVDRIFDDVTANGASIVLISHSMVTGKRGPMNAWCAELFLQYQDPDMEAQPKAEKVRLLIDGATVRNRLKSQVVTAVMNGQEVPLYLEDNGNLIQVHQPGVPGTAGAVSEKNSEADIKKVRDLLKKKNMLPVVPTGDVEQSKSVINYYVEATLSEDSTADYGNEIARITAAAILSKEDVSARVDFMVSNGVPDKIIKAVLNQMRFFQPEDRAAIPCPEVPYTQATGNNLARTLGYALCGRNIRTFGPKGGGKNTLIETVLWLMNQPMYRMSVSGDIDKYDLLGGGALRDGNTCTEISDMLKCLQKGYAVIFDEANAARAEVLEGIHSITDGARAIQVPGYGLVRLHPKALVFMTMNEGYCGCGEMNEATIDRFVPMEVEPEANIRELLKSMCPKATKDQVEVCEKIHAAIIAGIKQGKYSPNCISLRGFKDALLACEYLSLNQALVDNLANKSQDADERKSLTSLVNDFTGTMFN